MVQTVKKVKTNFKTGRTTGAGKIDRYKIGSAPPQNFTPKETGSGVMSMKMPKVIPSRPQGKEFMGIGGRKAKTKGRTDPKAANPRDPGPTPMPSTKVHYLTPNKNAQKGYIRNGKWPADNTGGEKSFGITDPPPSRKA